MGALYASYFKHKDAAKILTLYASEGVDPKLLEEIGQTHARYFDRHIEGVTFGPVNLSMFDVAVPYSYTSHDLKAKMVATVTPIRQMRVDLKSNQPLRSNQEFCVGTAFTMVGKKGNGYYLVAFRRQPIHGAE